MTASASSSLLHDPSLPPGASQALLDAMGTPLALVDGDGLIVAVNRAWREFMGANGGDEGACGPGTNYLAVCDAAPPANEGQDLGRGLRAVLAGQQAGFCVEYPCHSPTERRWYQARVTPVAPQGAQPTHAVVAHENVSALRLAQLRQQGMSAEVEQAVSTRTSVLQQANAELDHFAAALAHDFKAPVRHILGFLGLLRRARGAEGTERERRLLDQIEGAAGRLGAIIDQMLALSRAARHEVAFEDVDLDAVLRGAWDALAPEREHHPARLSVPGPLPRVRGDAELLGLVFGNLLGNALKYSRHAAESQIEVRCQPVGDHWELCVQDNGVGFDPAEAHKLFGAFQRLHREDEFEGSGIGLLNVRRIVARHGGTVRATGEIGQGATFCFTLPR